jgi:hypothetical protein
MRIITGGTVLLLMGPALIGSTDSTALFRRPTPGACSGRLPLAMASSYDFTTKATGTLRTQAAEEPPL